MIMIIVMTYIVYFVSNIWVMLMIKVGGLRGFWRALSKGGVANRFNNTTCQDVTWINRPTTCLKHARRRHWSSCPGFLKRRLLKWSWNTWMIPRSWPMGSLIPCPDARSHAAILRRMRVRTTSDMWFASMGLMSFVCLGLSSRVGMCWQSVWTS